jgi:hypothetical protein
VVAVRAAVVYALVECEKIPAIVLEVVGMPCRGLFLDFQKELGLFGNLIEVHYDDVPASDVRCFTKQILRNNVRLTKLVVSDCHEHSAQSGYQQRSTSLPLVS